MLIKLSTDKTVSQTAAALHAAVQASHFGVMQVHKLKETILATLQPTTLLAMFNTPQLKGVAQEVEDMVVKIMNEAASGRLESYLAWGEHPIAKNDITP